MRKILSSIVALILAASCAAGFAQGNQTYQQRWFFASDFGQWSVRGQQANTFQWSPGTICNVSANGSATSFFAFNTNAPVLVVDATPANSEVLTPSAVTNSPSFCGVTVAPAHSHYSFSVVSGTGGLQETLNSISPVQAAPSLVWLDRNWYALAGAVPGTTPAAIITAAKGGISAILVDNTTAPFTNYVWGGTSYASGTWVNTAPAGAVGGAAGSSPSAVTVSGAALSGTAAFSTGTATTTGTLFTLTYAASDQFAYVPACTVTSIGTNSFTAFTVAAATAGHVVVTVTATSAPVASTAYNFAFACH